MGSIGRPQSDIGDRPETAAAALERYAGIRLARSGESGSRGVTAALELVAQFVDQMAPELLDALTRRRLSRRESLPPRDLLDPSALLRLLGPSALLFPYSILAGGGVLRAFSSEVPRLARWLLAQWPESRVESPLFSSYWRRARGPLRRHALLQAAVETMSTPFLLTGPDEISVGHYLIEEAHPGRLAVRAGETRIDPVRYPVRFAAEFRAGDSVSLALLRTGVGYLPLAINLPLSQETFDALLEESRLSPPIPS